ncbi:MAG: type II toxin-antitoxin system HicB family antitoxin [Planctomycetota bacterium]|nr:type II toxin-antitoxin system HicB family antitoxin [Planctomycetota bacterium]
MTSRYRMLIEWSEEDQVFVVTLPEFPCNRTHGATYEEAAKNGKEVLELLIETWEQDGRPLPPPQFFVSDSVSA